MSDGLFNDMPSETLRRVWLAAAGLTAEHFR